MYIGGGKFYLRLVTPCVSVSPCKCMDPIHADGFSGYHPVRMICGEVDIGDFITFRGDGLIFIVVGDGC